MGAKEVVEVIGILIALLTLIFQFMPDPHDFTISVDPVKVDIEQDDIAYTSVEVDPGLLYNKDVNLRAESVSSSIRIFFDPVALEHGSKSVSRICIIAENGTLLGEHLIKIVGSGSDGKNHSCTLNLKVHPIHWSPIAATPIAATPTPEIKITYPLNGAQVSAKESVQGTQKNITEDKAIWIVVFPYKSYNYHPVQEVRIQDGTSDFSVPVTIGTPESVGEKFDIIAVLADKQAQEVFTSYLKTAAVKGIYPGISKLPEGAEEYDKVTVTRE